VAYTARPVYIWKVFGAVDDGDQRANDRPVDGHVGEDGCRMVDCPRRHGARSRRLLSYRASRSGDEGSMRGAEKPPNRGLLNVHALRSRRPRSEECHWRGQEGGD
jgi:hypothetical protein